MNVCPLGENQAAVHHDTWNKGTLFWQPQNICLISLVVFLLYFTWSSIILWLDQTFFYILPKFGKLGTIPLQRKINIINIKTTIVRLAFPVHKRQYWTKKYVDNFVLQYIINLNQLLLFCYTYAFSFSLGPYGAAKYDMGQNKANKET